MLVFRSILVPLKAALGFLLTRRRHVRRHRRGLPAGPPGRPVRRLDTPGPLVSFLPILLIGILFGLAMDYEVFLVSRMREDFVHGDSRATGDRHRLRARRPVVVTAAALIMIAVFGGFVLVDDPMIKSIGFALAIGVALRRLRRPDDHRARR